VGQTSKKANFSQIEESMKGPPLRQKRGEVTASVGERKSIPDSPPQARSKRIKGSERDIHGKVRRKPGVSLL